jgi:hypothetical protein
MTMSNYFDENSNFNIYCKRCNSKLTITYIEQDPSEESEYQRLDPWGLPEVYINATVKPCRCLELKQ